MSESTFSDIPIHIFDVQYKGIMPFTGNKGPDQTAHAQSDQGLYCPLTESFYRRTAKALIPLIGFAQADLDLCCLHMTYGPLTQITHHIFGLSS